MSKIDCLLLRDTFDVDFTLGQFFTHDNRRLAYTCEDRDRYLETGGTKIPKETAIPRGYYRMRVTMSQRFGRELPIIEGVPQFSGVRIHGGNTKEDTEGCPLIGRERTPDGVRDCKRPVNDLVQYIKDTEAAGDEAWVVVR